jgi:hypothetical protein
MGSTDVADLIAMVEDLRVLDAVLGVGPEQDEDLKLIRDQLNAFSAALDAADEDDGDLLNDINKAEAIVDKLKLNSVTAAEQFIENVVSDESLVLSAQNAFIRRLLGGCASRIAVVETSSAVAMAVDFTGLSANFRIESAHGGVEIFAISNYRQERVGFVAGGIVEFRLSPDLWLSFSSDGVSVVHERRVDLLWLLDAENPKLKVLGGELILISV